MTHFFVRVQGNFDRIEVADIRYIESDGNYVKVWVGNRYVIIHSTLKRLLTLLPAGDFIRVHRAYIISMRHLTSFNNNFVVVDNKQLPVGDGGVKELKAAVKILEVQPASQGGLPPS